MFVYGLVKAAETAALSMGVKPPNVTEAYKADRLFLVFLWVTGLLHEDPIFWYKTAVQCFVVIMIMFYFGATSTVLLTRIVGEAELLQDPQKSQPTLYWQEFVDCVIGHGLTVCTIVAWPVSMYLAGKDMALRSTMEECVFGLTGTVGVLVYTLKCFLAILAADCWNYWKHRAFHGKWLWGFHKIHHAHHNPSAFGSFSTSVVYGWATFAPIYAFCFPISAIYAPLHLPWLVFLYFLNFYLHCGYEIPLLESIFKRFWIISSGWHNMHHKIGRPGMNAKEQTFSEVFIIWDVLCGTFPKEHAKRIYGMSFFGPTKTNSKETPSNTKTRTD